jgi:hypothetical protein
MSNTFETEFKGIVSRDWQGCKWVHWIDLNFVRSCLRFIFNLKFILNSYYFKMASVQVHFSPGFPLGGGFPAEQILLLRNSIWRIFSKVYKQCCNPDHGYMKMRETIEGYTWCSAYFEYRRSKNLTVCSPEKFPSLRSSKYRQSKT